MLLEGTARTGRKTKDLVKELLPGEIAVIAHKDLDQVAAQSLAEAKVRAVINCAPSISGRYPNLGPRYLLENAIPLIDVDDETMVDTLNKKRIQVDTESGTITDLETGVKLISGQPWTESAVKEKLERARANLHDEVARFIDNTLEYAKREKGFVLGDVRIPELRTVFADRHVVVVVRGQNYKQDLQAIASYIDEVNPVLVGVDGGADALLEMGLIPDLIVGDMDSVSDRALHSGAELLVHAYPDGTAPGLARLEKMNMPAKTIAAPGTSEDIALLVAYEKGADIIVAVGTHSNIIDFLEKGRPGMASTFLVRLKIGSILIDAKGLSKIYRGKPRKSYVVQIAVAALAPLLLITLMSPIVRQFLRLFALQMRVSLGW